jgi:nucleotide-binding universal stress UspA family protein
MYDILLVPIDFEHKERIKPMITAARALGNKGCRIVLANIFENSSLYATSDFETYHNRDLDLETQRKAYLDLEQIADQFDLPPDIQIGRGHPAKEILEIAETIKANVIVIASHKPGWQDYLIGSTATRIVSHANCAVHVIR